MSAAPERRIVAVALPDLLCELALATLRPPPSDQAEAPRPRWQPPPLGVVLVEPRTENPTAATTMLDAVNVEARRYGVRDGQSIAEACALVARLTVREVEKAAVLAELGRIAEVALAFGPTVSIEAPDTVWVDVTGSAHLAGGEAALAEELASRVRALGHVVRVALSSGPLLAQAFARWSSPAELGPRGARVVSASRTAAEAAKLPLAALPIARDCAGWLCRLGVLSFGDLEKLPRAAAAARLGDQASIALDLCEGRDAAPLVAYAPPVVPVEESSWDDPVAGSEPLLFALRGLAARLSARLEGRGEAAQSLELVILHDRSIARLAGAAPPPRLHFELSAPLWREADLRRVITARLERTRLSAPSRGLRLTAPVVTRSLPFQLDLGGASRLGPEALPVLLAEIASDVGADHVGVLGLHDAHRPETQGMLCAAVPDLRGRKKRAGMREKAALHGPAPTRLLARPLALDGALRRGAFVSVDRHLYSIEKVVFDHRLDLVEWWTRSPAARDYLRLSLSGADGALEALVYVDRRSGHRFLQGVFD